MPRYIATLLEKPNADKFTGHLLRKTATTLLVDAGVTRENLKQFGRWKSDMVAEGYIDESMVDKESLTCAIQKGEVAPTCSNRNFNVSVIANYNVGLFKNVRLCENLPPNGRKQ